MIQQEKNARMTIKPLLLKNFGKSILLHSYSLTFLNEICRFSIIITKQIRVIELIKI